MRVNNHIIFIFIWIWCVEKCRCCLRIKQLECQLYLQQRHLYPKPSIHPSVLQMHRRRAGQGSMRHRTGLPVYRWQSIIVTTATNSMMMWTHCTSSVTSYHFHIPWMHQIGFVTQNIPNFNMFVGWRGDQTSFNLTAQVQTCGNNQMFSFDFFFPPTQWKLTYINIIFVTQAQGARSNCFLQEQVRSGLHTTGLSTFRYQPGNQQYQTNALNIPEEHHNTYSLLRNKHYSICHV